MRKWVIISGILFTIGNATWRYIGLEKVFWLPLGVFLWVLILYVANNPKEASHPIKTGLYYMGALASGNIIKQAFYQDDLFQTEDYAWGICVTLFFVGYLFKDRISINLKKLWKWAIRIIRKTGGKE